MRTPLVLVTILLGLAAQGCGLVPQVSEHAPADVAVSDTTCPGALAAGERVSISMRPAPLRVDGESRRGAPDGGSLRARRGAGGAFDGAGYVTDVGYRVVGSAYVVDFTPVSGTWQDQHDGVLDLWLEWELLAFPGGDAMTWVSGPCRYGRTTDGFALQSADVAAVGAPASVGAGVEDAEDAEAMFCPLLGQERADELFELSLLPRDAVEDAAAPDGQVTCAGIADLDGITFSVVATPGDRVRTIGGAPPLESFRRTLELSGITPEDVEVRTHPAVFGDDEGAVAAVSLEGWEDQDDGRHRAQLAVDRTEWLVVVRVESESQWPVTAQERRDLALSLAQEAVARLP